MVFIACRRGLVSGSARRSSNSSSGRLWRPAAFTLVVQFLFNLRMSSSTCSLVPRPFLVGGVRRGEEGGSKCGDVGLLVSRTLTLCKSGYVILTSAVNHSYLHTQAPPLQENGESLGTRLDHSTILIYIIQH